MSAIHAAFPLWRQPLQKWLTCIDPEASRDWPEPGNVSARAIRKFLTSHQFSRHEKVLIPSRTIIHRMLKQWRALNDPFYVPKRSPGENSPNGPQ